MQALHFPAYEFRFKSRENAVHIFDPIRKKFVALQPEEWVRQHVIRYLMHEKNYPASLLGVERQIRVNSLVKRCDMVVYRTDASIHILVECKAPDQVISQHTFDQIARYNLQLNAGFLMVTNGLSHFFCRLDRQRECYEFLQELPPYPGADQNSTGGATY